MKSQIEINQNFAKKTHNTLNKRGFDLESWNKYEHITISIYHLISPPFCQDFSTNQSSLLTSFIYSLNAIFITSHLINAFSIEDKNAAQKVRDFKRAMLKTELSKPESLQTTKKG